MCLPVIPAVADGFMVWSSTVAERNVLSTSDLFGFRCPILFYFPAARVDLYIYGVGIVGIIVFSIIRFWTVARCRSHALSCSRARSDPAVGVPASRWHIGGILTTFLPIDYAAVPGRILLLYPISFEHLIVFPRFWFWVRPFPLAW